MLHIWGLIFSEIRHRRSVFFWFLVFSRSPTSGIWFFLEFPSESGSSEYRKPQYCKKTKQNWLNTLTLIINSKRYTVSKKKKNKRLCNVIQSRSIIISVSIFPWYLSFTALDLIKRLQSSIWISHTYFQLSAQKVEANQYSLRAN